MHYLYKTMKIYKTMNIKLFVCILILFFYKATEAQIIDTVFTTENSGISYNIVNTVTSDSQNRLFIGTEWGLSIYENETWEVWRADESPLPEDKIRTVYSDPQNQVWVGGFLNTPSIIENDSLVPFELEPPLSNHIKDILLVQQNEGEILYMATEGGLGIYNFKTENWEILDFFSAYIESSNFTSLAYDEDVGLLAGTFNGGLVIIKNNGQVETYFGEGVIPDNTISDIAIDENNLVWLASPAGGLITFNGSNFESISTFNSNIHSQSISCLWVVNSKEVWFGTNTAGLGLLKDGEFSHYDSNNSILIDNKINDLYLQNDSILWVATENGLAKLCIFDKILTTPTISVVDNLIFPNPATSKINIRQPFYDELHIYNRVGEVVFKSNSPIQQIEVSHFNPGLYYVTIKFNGLISVNKLSIF